MLSLTNFKNRFCGVSYGSMILLGEGADLKDSELKTTWLCFRESRSGAPSSSDIATDSIFNLCSSTACLKLLFSFCYPLFIYGLTGGSESSCKDSSSLNLKTVDSCPFETTVLPMLAFWVAVMHLRYSVAFGKKVLL